MSKPKIEIWFELENKCNLKCLFCYNYWRDGSLMPPRQIDAYKLIEAFEKLLNVAEISKITLSGGEPLLRKDLDVLLDYFSNLNIPLVITTNGLLLNEQRISHLIKKGVVTFEVPLHSHNAQTHNQLSGIDCFEDSLDTIITLKKYPINVVPVFVATSLNLMDFLEVIKIYKYLGINDIIFNRVIPSGMVEVNKDVLGIPLDSEMEDVLCNSYDYLKQNSIRVHLGVPIYSKVLADKVDFIKSASCPVRIAQTMWTVDSGANIRRCNHSSFSIGNLLTGGEKILEIELSKKSGCDNGFHPCQFIETNNNFEVSVFS